MNLDWNLIRSLADYSSRAYLGSTVSDPATKASAIVSLTPAGDVVVAFQGSCNAKDFIQDAEFWMSDLTCSNGLTARVHHGFLEDFEAINVAVVNQVKNFLALPGERKVFITGHSLGGALAILCALEFARQNLPVQAVITFGQPRVGNATFREVYDEALPLQPNAAYRQMNGACVKLKEITFRIVNQNDIVPRTPGVLLGYRHCGEEIFLEPSGGWGLNPSTGYKLFSDALGLWTAYRKKCDVLVTEHFIRAYQERIQGIL